MVTDCVLKEIQNGGSRLHGHGIVAKAFYRVKCAHHPSLPSGECLMSQVSDSNSKGFMIATNDEALQHQARSQGGVPVLTIHGQVPILEGPSEQSKRIAKSKETTKATVPEWEKEIHGIEEPEVQLETTKKKKKLKSPNPLSVRKKVIKSVPEPTEKKRTRRKKRN